MMKVRQLLVRCLLLLRSVCSQAPISRREYAWAGTDVVLECRSQTTDSINQVTWQRAENGEDKNFFVNVIGHGTNKLTPFALERVDFLGRESTDGSIRIRSVTLADEGLYTCIFTATRSGATKYPITLTVQVKPDLQLKPSPGFVVPANPPYETVATCIAGASKPSANITWLTGELEYNASVDVSAHSNGTATTLSELRMVPTSKIQGSNVTCVISQHSGTLDVSTERASLTIQNVLYPPESVQVMLRILDDGTFQFTCKEDSNPPATNITWRRMDSFESESSVELGSGASFSGKHLPDGVYTCEVTNRLGRSSGSLYLYTTPGSNACLHACLWPWLILLLIMGILIILWYRRLQVLRKREPPIDWWYPLTCCGHQRGEDRREAAYRGVRKTEAKEEEPDDLGETLH